MHSQHFAFKNCTDMAKLLLALSLAATSLSALADDERSPNVLNHPIHDKADVWFARGFDFTPDSTRVLFGGDFDVNSRHELYSVAATGGETVRLNSDLVKEGDVFWDGVEIGPNSRVVVYVGDQERDGIPELYAIPSEGGSEPIKLSPVIGEEGGVAQGSVCFSPDSSKVVFRATLDKEQSMHLFCAAVDGSATMQLSPELLPGAHIASHGLAVTPDGKSVIYLSNPAGDRTWRLFTVPITGGTPVEISPTLPPGGTVDPMGIKISPDGSHVVYRASVTARGHIGLFASPLDGSGPARALHGELGPLDDVLEPGLMFHGDSELIFIKQTSNPGNAGPERLASQREIQIVSLAPGSTPRTVATVTTPGWTLSTTHVQTCPTAGYVVYAEQIVTEEHDNESEEFIYEHRLLAAPVAGGEPILLVAATPNLRGAVVLPGQGRVAVVSDLAEEGRMELFSVSLTGGPVVKLSPELKKMGQVLSARPTLDGRQVVFLATLEEEEKYELFRAPAAGGPAVRISGELPDNASVYSIAMSPDGKSLVYTADQDDRGKIEIFYAVLDDSKDGQVASAPLVQRSSSTPTRN